MIEWVQLGAVLAAAFAYLVGAPLFLDWRDRKKYREWLRGNR